MQEKEGDLHKLQIELSRKMMLFEEKEKSIEKLIQIRTDQKISEYDAQAGFQRDSFRSILTLTRILTLNRHL